MEQYDVPIVKGCWYFSSVSAQILKDLFWSHCIPADFKRRRLQSQLLQHLMNQRDAINFAVAAVSTPLKSHANKTVTH
jgi:hypothetical protein